MLSKFFGKPDGSPTKAAKDEHGLVVTEVDSETAWKKWDKALAQQDAKALQPAAAKPLANSAPPKPVRPPFRAPAPAAGQVPTLIDPVVPASQANPAAQNIDSELDFVLPTEPMALEELTLEQRKKLALETVDLYHHRIANTIRTMWGYRECSVYINKLIMAGGDGMGHARVGFNQEAVEAMLALSDIHDAEFGAPSTMGGALGLSL
jgi:hypothetical protein